MCCISCYHLFGEIKSYNSCLSKSISILRLQLCHMSTFRLYISKKHGIIWAACETRMPPKVTSSPIQRFWPGKVSRVLCVRATKKWKENTSTSYDFPHLWQSNFNDLLDIDVIFRTVHGSYDHHWTAFMIMGLDRGRMLTSLFLVFLLFSFTFFVYSMW